LPAQPLVAMVPVSVRTEEHGASLGNQVSSMAAVLHTDESDPVARIGKIAASMRDQKILQAALPVHAQLGRGRFPLTVVGQPHQHRRAELPRACPVRGHQWGQREGDLVAHPTRRMLVGGRPRETTEIHPFP